MSIAVEYYLHCDKCGETAVSTASHTPEMATREGRKQGWLIKITNLKRNRRDYCPTCRPTCRVEVEKDVPA